MTDVIRVDPASPDPAAIERAADLLRRGCLVAFPTETVYGLGVHALDAAAVRRLFTAKGRPATDPLIVHVASLDGLNALAARMPDGVALLAQRFWPGPLTIIVPRSLAVPLEVTAGLDTVAIRIPAHPVARALIEAAGVPVAAPSANLFSHPSPTRAEHVLDDLRGRIDAVVDGGPTTLGVESTVLDMTGERPTILRPGAVTHAMLSGVLGDVGQDAVTRETGAMPSPGLLSRHYSPRAPLTLYEGRRPAVLIRVQADAAAAAAAGRRVGLLLADEDEIDVPAAHVVRLGSHNDFHGVASRLYASLRELDAAALDEIFAIGFASDDGLAAAIADRLRRAAAGRVVRV